MQTLLEPADLVEQQVPQHRPPTREECERNIRMRQLARETAFNEGLIAYEEGLYFTQNPYPKLSPHGEHLEWERGFRNGPQLARAHSVHAESEPARPQAKPTFWFFRWLRKTV